MDVKILTILRHLGVFSSIFLNYLIKLRTRYLDFLARIDKLQKLAPDYWQEVSTSIFADIVYVPFFLSCLIKLMFSLAVRAIRNG